jgi:hypothetical protein
MADDHSSIVLPLQHRTGVSWGRNGSFVAQSLEVTITADQVAITAYSRRQGQMPPVAITLSRQDARTLLSRLAGELA